MAGLAHIGGLLGWPKPAQDRALPTVCFPGPPTAVARAFGLPRVGNHGVIHWVLRNLPSATYSNIVFLNNCMPGYHPTRSFREIEIDGEMWRPFDLRQDRSQLHGKVKRGYFLLTSYECWTDEIARDPDWPRSRGKNWPPYAWQMLIHRSFLNWVASFLLLQRKLFAKRRPKKQSQERARDKAVGMIPSYDALIRAANAAEGMTDLSYDEWATSPGYREQALARLDLPRRDNSLGKVAAYGGGSSFEQGVVQGEDLSTTQRWRGLYDTDMDYRHILRTARETPEFLSNLGHVYPDDADILSSLKL